MKRINDINSWNLFQLGQGTPSFENTFNWTKTDYMLYVFSIGSQIKCWLSRLEFTKYMSE